MSPRHMDRCKGSLEPKPEVVVKPLMLGILVHPCAGSFNPSEGFVRVEMEDFGHDKDLKNLLKIFQPKAKPAKTPKCPINRRLFCLGKVQCRRSRDYGQGQACQVVVEI